MDHLYVLVPLTLLATVQPELVGGVVEVSPPEAVANMDIENLDMERYYTVIIDNNDEDCFIFEAMQNSTLNLEYTVVNSNPSNGKPMDITAYIVDPRERKVFYKYRKTEGELHGFPIEHEGEYQLCLSNKFSGTLAKQVYWEIIIEGMPDMKAFEQSVIDSVMKEFGNNVDDITKSLYQVRFGAFKSLKYLRTSRTERTRDILYLSALSDMIDKWSMIHAFLVVFVTIGQVTFLKKLFASPLGSQRMNART